MRNLRLLNRLAIGGDFGISDPLCLAMDIDAGVVFTATSTEIFAIDRQAGEVLGRVSILPDGPVSESTPVGLEYLFDQRAVCLATRDGRICLWQYDLDGQLEVVGEVMQRITAMSWSPDYELLIITAGDGKLLMMTSEFDVITETTMFPDHQGEDSNVAVGWGKKETQFHGSAGKQAAKVENVEVQPVSERDDGLPRISWRGDGQFFAVSVIEPDTGGRLVYTWSRECVLQARSEAVDGLQHSLCWKPTGSLIASLQTKRHANTQEVVFFEKNGLRHGEFLIPPYTENEFVIQQIMWNQDSTILALHIDYYKGSQKLKLSCIQLWTVNNYHWYLKQNVTFEDGLGAALWDSEHACKMHIMTRAGHFVTYTWAWSTDHTSGATEDDMSLVAVINGAKILVTPLRTMLVPPPMSAFTLTCQSPVNQIAFGPCLGSNDLIAYLSCGKVALFHFNGVKNDPQSINTSGDGFKIVCEEPGLKAIYDIRCVEPEFLATEMSHLLWVSEELIIMATQRKGSQASVLLLGWIKPEENAVIVKDRVEVNSVILNMSFNQETKNIAVELADGTVMKFMPATKILTHWLNMQGNRVSFPSPCTQIAVTHIGCEEVVLGLTERFRFFVNDFEVSSNCTSFGIHNDFVLLTTLSHSLRCLPKSLKPADLPKLSGEKAHPFDESSRRVERGSCIVTVVADDTKVVLQMPRGNLETIHPRALLISSLKKLMDGNKISEAFMTMRKHRINMNLLHDHNPQYFVKNVDNFIETVNNQSYLNVFLTDLIEEDVTQTMYSASYSQITNTDVKTVTHETSKVDTVCDAFLAAFQRLGVNRYIQSVLTAYARKTTPELEKALQLVWSLHGQAESSAEAALNYLLFLVDVNTLYDVALGTYNFDLVMMVAQKSQKDPKEYVPFLNQLRRLEENYRYYSIDKHLKKYSKALDHISKCGDEHFEECVSLVSENKLYGQALQLYKSGSSQFKHLATLYGNYLLTKNRHDEAGIEFIRAEEWVLALEAFRRDWQQVFCMAHRLEYSASQLSELAVKIAGDLKGRQKYGEAAAVLIEYAKDVEEAVVALVEGCHWKEALRQMYCFKRLDLIDTHLLPAIQENWELYTDLLASQREQFERHRARLHVVRAQKAKAAADLLEGTAEYNDAEADLFSDTTSMTGASVASLTSSNSSRSTVFTKGTGSARTRRKADNKKWSLKEGSAHEEFALVDAEAKIIKAVDGFKEDINNLLKILVQFNFDQKALKLQESYSSFLQLLQSSIPEIWIYGQKSSSDNLNLGPNVTANAAAQALQKGHLLQGDEEQQDPVLLVPPTLNKDTRWKLHISSDQDR